ncbi:chemotaxis protein CheX [Isoptericola sp. b441]|uniref:Chemotaxis protein CheX n=1 Tax=Actinotalea lenta TaxID=3064654 RepID=A0ABT9D5L2_9CELL|nr:MULTISPECIES: chemotaxis protein CheX [unclassified Isoptericola]MDO8106094.1 chemotaxis protein CheX [Isoptericola sp. b441]MDO8122187.1 chemotaxis protein CheX [Isoptericola sp. b490]
MSAAIDMSVFSETVFAIAEEVFSAMIDPEPGALQPSVEDVEAPADATYAWVDVHGEHPGRVMLGTEHETAMLLTRALLMMAQDEEVSDADFVDAVGEIANVVGGNVKALVPDPGPLTLPQVAAEPPADGAVLLHDAQFAWRGRPLGISLWSLP